MIEATVDFIEKSHSFAGWEIVGELRDRQHVAGEKAHVPQVVDHERKPAGGGGATRRQRHAAAAAATAGARETRAAPAWVAHVQKVAAQVRDERLRRYHAAQLLLWAASRERAWEDVSERKALADVRVERCTGGHVAVGRLAAISSRQKDGELHLS